MGQIRLFLHIYIRPLRAFGPVIDEARLAFAVGIALLAVLAVQAPRYAEYRSISEQALRYVKEHPAPPALSKKTAAKSPAPGVGQGVGQSPSATPPPRTPLDATGKATPAEASDPDDGDSDDEDASGVLAAIGPLPLGYAVDQVIGLAPFHYLPPILSLALCFVPAALLIVTLWQGLGRFTNVLFRDYLTLLVCKSDGVGGRLSASRNRQLRPIVPAPGVAQRAGIVVGGEPLFSRPVGLRHPHSDGRQPATRRRRCRGRVDGRRRWSLAVLHLGQRNVVSRLSMPAVLPVGESTGLLPFDRLRIDLSPTDEAQPGKPHHQSQGRRSTLPTRHDLFPAPPVRAGRGPIPEGH